MFRKYPLTSTLLLRLGSCPARVVHFRHAKQYVTSYQDQRGNFSTPTWLTYWVSQLGESRSANYRYTTTQL
ncbi:hypothetical protein F5B21DRAFT_472645 [Xylaria acuta]|nr:hypothetical protein F5B21DRAFT_472645 [Xylaria acuta]